MSKQMEIIQALDEKPEINAIKEIRNRIDFLKAYCSKVGAKGFVLGISGGQDSTLAGRLSQLAAEELRQKVMKPNFMQFGSLMDAKR